LPRDFPITVTDFVAGAQAARGVTIVIDVFRACSLVCYALAGGVARILPVAASETALELKRSHPDWLIAGERHARKLPGFDFGNSPSDIASTQLRGRTLVHTTHAGTQGLTGALGAELVLTGALVNASATAKHARALAPREITIVRMGLEARERCLEDDLCAELLLARLTDAPFDAASLRERLRAAPAAAKFFDPAAHWAPQRDFELCTDVDRFDFAVELVRDGSPYPWLRRVTA
jgi:2-phosphosulfolactate phosphatase